VYGNCESKNNDELVMDEKDKKYDFPLFINDKKNKKYDSIYNNINHIYQIEEIDDIPPIINLSEDFFAEIDNEDNNFNEDYVLKNEIFKLNFFNNRKINLKKICCGGNCFSIFLTGKLIIYFIFIFIKI
jgi:hypothetical protein